MVLVRGERQHGDEAEREPGPAGNAVRAPVAAVLALRGYVFEAGEGRGEFWVGGGASWLAFFFGGGLSAWVSLRVRVEGCGCGGGGVVWGGGRGGAETYRGCRR